MQYGIDAVELVKEAKRAMSHLEPYNEEVVRAVQRETRDLFQEALHAYEEASKDDEPGPKARVLMMQRFLYRNKQSLLAYHYNRLLVIRELAVRLPTLPSEAIRLLARPEQNFLEAYRIAMNAYNSSFNGLLNVSTIASPPKDYYVQVRAIRDCGDVQTEMGRIRIDANGFYFLKKTDVEHLIAQGFLVHVQ